MGNKEGEEEEEEEEEEQEDDTVQLSLRVKIGGAWW